MPLTIARFKPEDVSSEEASKALTNTSNHYKFEYFVVSSAGSVPRDILAYSGADWEDKEITVSAPPSCFALNYFLTDQTPFRQYNDRTGPQRKTRLLASSQSCTSTPPTAST